MAALNDHNQNFDFFLYFGLDFLSHPGEHFDGFISVVFVLCAHFLLSVQLSGKAKECIS